nr:hypothetical protein GCM10020093_100920 [Planobispora longispora]
MPLTGRKLISAVLRLAESPEGAPDGQEQLARLGELADATAAACRDARLPPWSGPSTRTASASCSRCPRGPSPSRP